MSLFKVFKYSSLLFFLNKYRGKLYRIAAVLLFALITSLLYADVEAYLALRHPETVIYALIGKIVIVYGALAFVLWQFRPEPDDGPTDAATKPAPAPSQASAATEPPRPASALDELENLDSHDALRSRYDRILEKTARKGSKK